jgi:hypothetical protein
LLKQDKRAFVLSLLVLEKHFQHINTTLPFCAAAMAQPEEISLKGKALDKGHQPVSALIIRQCKNFGVGGFGSPDGPS